MKTALTAIAFVVHPHPPSPATDSGNMPHPIVPRQTFHLSTGIIVEFCCAIGQALYFVVYRKYAIRGGQLPATISALIAGFEGLAHLLVFWVFFVVLDLTGYEKFEWPDAEQLQSLVLGASITSTGCISIMVARLVRGGKNNGRVGCGVSLGFVGPATRTHAPRVGLTARAGRRTKSK